MSNSLQPHGLQHTRPPCPSPSPGACSNSFPLSHWCHPTISSSVVPFSYLQSFPASGAFPKFWPFTSSGQSTGASATMSILPMNIQDWFPLGWTGWISLQSKWLSRVFSNTTVQKHHFFGAQPSLWSSAHTYGPTFENLLLWGHCSPPHCSHRLLATICELTFPQSQPGWWSRFQVLFGLCVNRLQCGLRARGKLLPPGPTLPASPTPSPGPSVPSWESRAFIHCPLMAQSLGIHHFNISADTELFPLCL